MWPLLAIVRCSEGQRPSVRTSTPEDGHIARHHQVDDEHDKMRMGGYRSNGAGVFVNADL